MEKIKPIEIIQIILLLGTILMAMCDITGWGWFLFAFLLTL